MPEDDDARPGDGAKIGKVQGDRTQGTEGGPGARLPDIAWHRVIVLGKKGPHTITSWKGPHILYTSWAPSEVHIASMSSS